MGKKKIIKLESIVGVPPHGIVLVDGDLYDYEIKSSKPQQSSWEEETGQNIRDAFRLNAFSSNGIMVVKLDKAISIAKNQIMALLLSQRRELIREIKKLKPTRKNEFYEGYRWAIKDLLAKLEEKP